MMLDSPNSTPNLNPSFQPLSNFPFPSSPPLFINTHQDLLVDHHFPLPGVHETLIVSEMGAPGAGCTPPSTSKLHSAAAKRGRHSKIHTSQGLRDRRVRLSIGIARQFFDLQDMLGFDKASKTLDWLLSKSSNAIKELALRMNESPAISDFHVATGETGSIGSNQKGDHVNSLQGCSKKKKITKACRKKISCGSPTAMNQSSVTRASTSTSQKDNNQDNDYYFPNLALDWDKLYNPVLPPSSFAVSTHINLSETGVGAQREQTPCINWCPN